MSSPTFVRMFRRMQTISTRLIKNIAETNCPVQRARLYNTLVQVNKQLAEMQDLLVRAFINYSRIDFTLLQTTDM